MPKRVTTTLILFMIPSLLRSVNPPAARNPTNSAHFNSARSPEPWYWCVLLLLYCKSPLFRVCVTLVLQQIVRDIKLVSFCLSEGFFEARDLGSEIFCVLLSWSSFGLFWKKWQKRQNVQKWVPPLCRKGFRENKKNFVICLRRYFFSCNRLLEISN